MGWFNRTAAEDADMAAQLTADEQAALDRLEATVLVGIGSVVAMVEAGKALAEIRRRQLYRVSAGSWEEYVDRRFQITKRRCDQMVAFAGLKEFLEEMGTPVPNLSEKAVRPLVGMPADELKAVLAEAAEGGEITAAGIRKATSRRKAKSAKVPRPRRYKVPGATVVITFNRKTDRSAINALAAAMAQAEEQLELEASREAA
jgi:hypothetical protein